MKTSVSLIISTFCFFLVACKDENSGPGMEGGPPQLSGTWRVYEYGYSPGGGYIRKNVPENPLLFLYFEPNGNGFQSNYPGLEEFQFYLILDHPQSENDILALYEQLPENPDDEDIMNLGYSFTIRPTLFQGIELWYRFCIEGCHIGIKKQLAID